MPQITLMLPDIQETCDIIDVALYPHVLKSRGLAADVLLLTYLLIFGSYWAWSVVHFLNDIRDMVEIRHFVSNKLGCSDRRMSMMTWAELLHKVVMVQQTTRLCITRDLDEHAVVSRVMRKDNYLIALINKGVLRLAPPPLVPTLTVALRGAAGKTAWAMEAASTLAHRAAQV
ncbi:hypothetical protein DUNSADRAFT_8826 [Dunaliella salina]|uniref:Autophagy-related protein 9 n=1 Tax=Dunaliella salina TaxID=3046 RepID=A0ABQ7GIL8_DUNSA|nr:hypothetical protein DUNSADRAFT_8826 [Dunaliella salina]|eukprot:KAF5834470.1 hypothetical protein DUNSADRAFT_8826 [Dunaliella salina]